MDPLDSVDILTDIDSALIGEVIDGRFCVESVIGGGAMSVVYKAHHLLLGRTAALKVMRSRLAAGDKAFVRFEREIHATSLINHPNIVRSLACGFLPDRRPYLALEYIDGKSLREMLDSQTCLAWTDAIPLFLQLADAVHHAHGCGVLHRDLKPENIMVVESPSGPMVKIVDFGVVALMAASAPSTQKVTTTNNGMPGSPPYMSPETCNNQPANERSDIYALGCVFYEMLTGAPPFSGESALDVMFKQVHEPAPSLPRHLAPPALRELIHQMLCKQPESRPATAAAVLEQLRSIRVPARGTPRRKSAPHSVPAEKHSTAPQRRRFPVALVGCLVGIALLSLLVWLIAFDSGTSFLVRCIGPSLKTQELELFGDHFRKEGRMQIATDLYAQASSRIPESEQLSPSALALQIKRIDAQTTGGNEDEGQQQCCDLFTRLVRAVGDDDSNEKKVVVCCRAAQQLWWRMDLPNRHKLKNPDWLRQVSHLGLSCMSYISPSAAYPFFAEAVKEQKGQTGFEGHEPAGDTINLAQCVLECSKPRPLEALALYRQALDYRLKEFAVPSIEAYSVLEVYRDILNTYVEMPDAKSALAVHEEAARFLKTSHAPADTALDHWLRCAEAIGKVSRDEAARDYERAVAVADAALKCPQINADAKKYVQVNYITASYYCAQNLLSAHKPQEALPLFERVVKMSSEVPTESAPWYDMSLAKNYMVLKNKAMAARALELASADMARLTPNDEKVRNMLKQLKDQLALL